MGNTVTKRMRKGIAKRNQKIARANKKKRSAEQAVKVEGKTKK
jgi:hypothetical protein